MFDSLPPEAFELVLEQIDCVRRHRAAGVSQKFAAALRRPKLCENIKADLESDAAIESFVRWMARRIGLLKNMTLAVREVAPGALLPALVLQAASARDIEFLFCELPDGCADAIIRQLYAILPLFTALERFDLWINHDEPRLPTLRNLTRVPTLKTLGIGSGSGYLPPVIFSHNLSRLSKVTLDCCDGVSLEFLSALPNLTELVIPFAADVEGWPALGLLTTLTALQLGDAESEEETGVRFNPVPLLANLTRLQRLGLNVWLEGNPGLGADGELPAVGPDGELDLVVPMPSLTHLTCYGLPFFHDAGFHALPQLRELLAWGVSACDDPRQVRQHLFSSGRFPTLQRAEVIAHFPEHCLAGGGLAACYSRARAPPA